MNEESTAGLQGTQARRRTSRTIALGLWLLGVALSLATLAMIALTLDRPAPTQWAFRGFEAAVALPWGLVGALIALQRPGHRLGWFFLAIALMAGIQGIVDQYPVLVDAGMAPDTGVEWIRWVSSWIWVTGTGGLLIFVPLLFPDGRLPSARWRPVFGLGVVAMLSIIVLIGSLTRPVGPVPLSRDPTQWGLAVAISFLLLGSAVALAVLSLVRRFLRSRGEQREQLKWVAYGGVIGLLGLAFDFSPNQGLQAIGAATAVVGAASVGIAILRYRLYEIDLLINRTIVYGALTAILAGVYTASITLSTRLFSALTGERSDAAIVLTTLIVVALFTPLKNRLQAAVDTRVKPTASLRPTAIGAAPDEAALAERLRALHDELHGGGEGGSRGLPRS